MFIVLCTLVMVCGKHKSNCAIKITNTDRSYMENSEPRATELTHPLSHIQVDWTLNTESNKQAPFRPPSLISEKRTCMDLTNSLKIYRVRFISRFFCCCKTNAIFQLLFVAIVEQASVWVQEGREHGYCSNIEKRILVFENCTTRNGESKHSWNNQRNKHAFYMELHISRVQVKCLYQYFDT